MQRKKTLGKKQQYPTKTSINLATHSRAWRDLRRVAPLALLLAIAIGLFCKFGVMDPLHSAAEAEDAAAVATEQLRQLRAGNADYEQVLEQYDSVYLTRGTAENVAATPVECLELMERDVLSAAKVESFSLADGVIVSKISGVTLNQISSICSRLSDEELVDSVQVYNASAGGSGMLTTATLNILLAVKGG